MSVASEGFCDVAFSTELSGMHGCQRCGVCVTDQLVLVGSKVLKLGPARLVGRVPQTKPTKPTLHYSFTHTEEHGDGGGSPETQGERARPPCFFQQCLP